MATERVTPEDAEKLLAEGYVYVDVRTQAEFELGHVPGAFNVPIRIRGAAGMVDNPDFLAVMERRFQKDARILLGCQTGSRSLRAAGLLEKAGFSILKELRTGWDGARDAFGRLEPGWVKKGLPVETGAPAGRKYDDLLGT